MKIYEVNVRFEGSDGWQQICACKTRKEAENEIKHQKTIEDDGDCEYDIVERLVGRNPKSGETRKAVTFRITPTAAKAIADAAERMGVSQSDIVQDYAMSLK